MVPTTTIKELDIFRSLTAEQLDQIADLSEEKRYKTNDVVFREYTPAEYVYVLLEGRISISVEVGNQKRTSVTTVTPGLIFGWSALVRPHQWTASAVCVEESTVLRIEGSGLRKMMDAHPDVGYKVMERIAQVVSGRLKDTRLQLINLIHWPAN